MASTPVRAFDERAMENRLQDPSYGKAAQRFSAWLRPASLLKGVLTPSAKTPELKHGFPASLPNDDVRVRTDDMEWVLVPECAGSSQPCAPITERTDATSSASSVDLDEWEFLQHAYVYSSVPGHTRTTRSTAVEAARTIQRTLAGMHPTNEIDVTRVMRWMLRPKTTYEVHPHVCRFGDFTVGIHNIHGDPHRHAAGPPSKRAPALLDTIPSATAVAATPMITPRPAFVVEEVFESDPQVPNHPALPAVLERRICLSTEAAPAAPFSGGASTLNTTPPVPAAPAAQHEQDTAIDAATATAPGHRDSEEAGGATGGSLRVYSKEDSQPSPTSSHSHSSAISSASASARSSAEFAEAPHDERLQLEAAKEHCRGGIAGSEGATGADLAAEEQEQERPAALQGVGAAADGAAADPVRRCVAWASDVARQASVAAAAVAASEANNTAVDKWGPPPSGANAGEFGAAADTDLRRHLSESLPLSSCAGVMGAAVRASARSTRDTCATARSTRDTYATARSTRSTRATGESFVTAQDSMSARSTRSTAQSFVSAREARSARSTGGRASTADTFVSAAESLGDVGPRCRGRETGVSEVADGRSTGCTFVSRDWRSTKWTLEGESRAGSCPGMRESCDENPSGEWRDCDGDTDGPPDPDSWWAEDSAGDGDAGMHMLDDIAGADGEGSAEDVTTRDVHAGDGLANDGEGAAEDMAEGRCALGRECEAADRDALVEICTGEGVRCNTWVRQQGQWLGIEAASRRTSACSLFPERDGPGPRATDASAWELQWPPVRVTRWLEEGPPDWEAEDAAAAAAERGGGGWGRQESLRRRKERVSDAVALGSLRSRMAAADDAVAAA